MIALVRRIEKLSFGLLRHWLAGIRSVTDLTGPSPERRLRPIFHPPCRLAFLATRQSILASHPALLARARSALATHHESSCQTPRALRRSSITSARRRGNPAERLTAFAGHLAQLSLSSGTPCYTPGDAQMTSGEPCPASGNVCETPRPVSERPRISGGMTGRMFGMCGQDSVRACTLCRRLRKSSGGRYELCAASGPFCGTPQTL